MDCLDRSALRRSLRLKRKTLDAAPQAQAAFAALQHLLACADYQAAQHIALYWAADGELNPALIATHAALAGKKVYLPRVKRDAHNGRYLEFARYCVGDALIKNHFGIAEPHEDAELCAAADLDLVLTPLVGIDQAGNRLGMGGGFYDRTFAFKQTAAAAKPVLMGFAYSWQAVEALPTEAWDVAMDAWLSESGLTWFNARAD